MARAITSEFVVNTAWKNWQNDPDVTTLANGNVVVVWDSFNSANDVQYIASQVFTPSGARVGGEKILSNLNQISDVPRVDALASGGYAVAWQAGADSILDPTDVYSATFSSGGGRVGAIRMANPAQFDKEYFAAEVVARPGSGYSVLWSQSRANKGEDPFHAEDSYTLSYDAASRPTKMYEINQRQFGDQHNVRADLLTNGNTVVVWESDYTSNSPYGVPSDVRGRFIGPDGRPKGAEFTISKDANGPNSGLGLADTDISVAALRDGRFVATWVDTVIDGYSNGDTAYRLYARIFDEDGKPQGAARHVNSFDARSIPDHSSVAALDGGGFVVVWDQWSDVRRDGHQADVYARTYSEYGAHVGGAFRINQEADGNQESPVVTGLKNGGFFVAYESEYLDGDNDSVVGRIYSGLTREEASLGGKLIATSRADRLVGTSKADRIDGGSGNDSIYGAGGNDTLIGRAGKDWLDGQSGNDRLFGDHGNDRLYGGIGADLLTGGSGADVFIYKSVRDSTPVVSGRDRIADFDGSDQIDLSRIDAVSGRKGNQEFDFIGKAKFSGDAGELRAEQRSDGTHIMADVNGDRKADLHIWLDDKILINEADFIL